MRISDWSSDVCSSDLRDLAVDAIFAASDMIAIGALRALDEAGLVVPDDVAVIGFDDLPAASLSHPPLTTVAQDYHRAGEKIGRAPSELQSLMRNSYAVFCL